ncbi:TolC family protein [Pedosphaera parvula]|uniref:Outer membrane efflux protein n=1 Tax=Pedosphaera parvula (strain Ellin514) TaxID=320771 RepID=B9XEW1_PEDPL|nr:TolC family protein [Pedosphaera parvula]EEF61621.1 outer membrane efflux protein [Pedosphaera parvula Ellin514]
MNFKSNLIFALLALFPWQGMAAQETNHEIVPDAAHRLSIEQVVSQVLSNNPSLKAAHARWEAMQERIPQARAWQDPRVGVDATAGRFVSVPPNSFTDYKYAAEQTLPLAGINRLQTKIAETDVASALADSTRKELDLIARAKTAFYRLANAYKQLALNRKNAALLKQYAEITRNKYEVGNRPQSDVLNAETELGKLEENKFDFERQISEAETELNVLMNRPAHSPLPQPANITFASTDWSPQTLNELALKHRPELLIAAKKIEAAQAQVEIAKRGWIPEPSLRVEASQYNEASQAISEVVVGFSFNLPWFNHKKYSAAIREKQKLLESSEQELDSLRTETLGRLRDQLKRIETFHHHTELFHTKIIPLAEQTVTATRLSYETDKASFLNLIEAQRTLEDSESMYWTHLYDYLSARAELEALIGVDPSLSTGNTNAYPTDYHE